MTDEQKNDSTAQHKMINLNDVAIAVGAIDVASKAGAFQGGDMEIVGGARNRLHEAVQAAKQPEEPPVVDAEVVEESAVAEK